MGRHSIGYIWAKFLFPIQTLIISELCPVHVIRLVSRVTPDSRVSADWAQNLLARVARSAFYISCHSSLWTFQQQAMFVFPVKVLRKHRITSLRSSPKGPKITKYNKTSSFVFLVIQRRLPLEVLLIQTCCRELGAAQQTVRMCHAQTQSIHK